MEQKEYLGFVFLWAIAVIFVFVHIDFGRLPFEDAAILMRYAKNFAESGDIIWNIGESPVEGATDFLAVIQIAFVYKLGFSISKAVLVLNLLYFFGIFSLIYIFSARFFRINLQTNILISLAFIFGPSTAYISTGFTTLFSVFWTSAALLAFVKTLFKFNIRNLIVFLVLSLFMSLSRPEGFFLSAFSILTLAFQHQKNFRKVLLFGTVIYAIPVLLFLVWKTQYFEHLLPPPFYKKNDSGLHISSINIAWQNIWRTSFPLLVFIALGIYLERKQILWMSIVPILGFLVIWVLISNEMNFFARYQYPIVPYILVLGAYFTKRISGNFKNASRAIFGILAILVLGFIISNEQFRSKAFFKDGRYDVAMLLNEYKSPEFTLVTTEAGILPLYSEWNCVDAWGLSDYEIAKNGITQTRLNEIQPEIIMYHGGSKIMSPLERPQSDYQNCIDTLETFAQSNDYILAANFGINPHDSHFYYIKPNFKYSKEITAKLQKTEYFWTTFGIRAFDFRKESKAKSK